MSTEAPATIREDFERLQRLVETYHVRVEELYKDLTRHEREEEEDLIDIRNRISSLHTAIAKMADDVQVFNRQMEKRIIERLTKVVKNVK